MRAVAPTLEFRALPLPAGHDYHQHHIPDMPFPLDHGDGGQNRPLWLRARITVSGSSSGRSPRTASIRFRLKTLAAIGLPLPLCRASGGKGGNDTYQFAIIEKKGMDLVPVDSPDFVWQSVPNPLVSQSTFALEGLTRGTYQVAVRGMYGV